MSFLALVTAPFLIILAVGALYDRYGDLALVRSALTGVSAAAPGLLLALVVKTLVHYRRSPTALAFMAIGFVALGLLRLPLFAVLLVLTPICIAANKKGFK